MNRWARWALQGRYLLSGEMTSTSFPPPPEVSELRFALHFFSGALRMSGDSPGSNLDSLEPPIRPGAMHKDVHDFHFICERREFPDSCHYQKKNSKCGFSARSQRKSPNGLWWYIDGQIRVRKCLAAYNKMTGVKFERRRQDRRKDETLRQQRKPGKKSAKSVTRSCFKDVSTDCRTLFSCREGTSGSRIKTAK